MTATVQRYTNREGKIGFKVVSPYLCKETNKQKSKIRKFNPSVEFASYAQPKKAAQKAANDYCAKINSVGGKEFFSEYTVQDAIKGYSEQVDKTKENGGLSYQDHDHIIHDINVLLFNTSVAKLAAKNITTKVMVDLILDLKNMGCSDDKIRRVIYKFKNVMDYCVGEGILKSNPIRNYKFRIKAEIRAVGKIEIPTHNDLKTFAENSSGLDKVIYTTIPWLGMRWSEWAALKWDDVGLNSSQVHVRSFLKKVKSAKWVEKDLGKTSAAKREIPLLPEIRNILETWKNSPDADKDYVYGKDHTWLNYNSFRQRLNTIKRQNKIGFKGGVHSFRHYYASFMIEAHRRQDCTLLEIAKWIGHKDPGFTMKRYAKCFDDDPETWMKKVDRFSELYKDTKAA